MLIWSRERTAACCNDDVAWLRSKRMCLYGPDCNWWIVAQGPSEQH